MDSPRMIHCNLTWVSVDHAMPPANKLVLVHIPTSNASFAIKAVHDREVSTGGAVRWDIGYNKDEPYEITHWAEIPTPPEEL